MKLLKVKDLDGNIRKAFIKEGYEACDVATIRKEATFKDVAEALSSSPLKFKAMGKMFKTWEGVDMVLFRCVVDTINARLA